MYFAVDIRDSYRISVYDTGSSGEVGMRENYLNIFSPVNTIIFRPFFLTCDVRVFVCTVQHTVYIRSHIGFSRPEPLSRRHM